MGGLIIFTAISIPYLVLSDRDVASLAVYGVAMGCAAIGFADDITKLTKRRSLGLSARWKLVAQFVLAAGQARQQLARARRVTVGVVAHEWSGQAVALPEAARQARVPKTAALGRPGGARSG